jgi:hypothetical protein
VTRRRILAINPNTSAAVTDAFVAEARRRAPWDVTVEGVTGRFGAGIVSTEAENVVAGHSALALAAEHAAGFDAVILAISFDTALRALRETLPVPVVGITEAALRAAGARPLGVVCFGAVSLPLYVRLIAAYGVSPVGLRGRRDRLGGRLPVARGQGPRRARRLPPPARPRRRGHRALRRRHRRHGRTPRARLGAAGVRRRPRPSRAASTMLASPRPVEPRPRPVGETTGLSPPSPP